MLTTLSTRSRVIDMYRYFLCYLVNIFCLFYIAIGLWLTNFSVFLHHRSNIHSKLYTTSMLSRIPNLVWHIEMAIALCSCRSLLPSLSCSTLHYVIYAPFDILVLRLFYSLWLLLSWHKTIHLLLLLLHSCF